MNSRRCRAWVADRHYGRPGPCQNQRGISLVRWAPTPLTTFAGFLCLVHRHVLERGGTVHFAQPEEVVAR